MYDRTLQQVDLQVENINIEQVWRFKTQLLINNKITFHRN